MATEMKAYLTLRCPICPNRSFRSVNMAEKHGLQDHGGAMVALRLNGQGSQPAHIGAGIHYLPRRCLR